MATDYKVGDKIRLVHEGVVTDMAPAGGWVTIDGGARVLGKGEVIEVLERKGPRPGTVAVLGCGVYVQLADGGVSAAYFGESHKGFTQILGGPVTKWGTVVHEPSA